MLLRARNVVKIVHRYRLQKMIGPAVPDRASESQLGAEQAERRTEFRLRRFSAARSALGRVTLLVEGRTAEGARAYRDGVA